MIPGDAAARSVTAGAIRAFCPLHALRTLGALHAFRALGPVGTAAAAAPVVGLHPRHPFRALRGLGSLCRHGALRGLSALRGYRGRRRHRRLGTVLVLARASRFVLHDAAVVAELDAHARAGRIDAADAQPVKACLGCLLYTYD